MAEETVAAGVLAALEREPRINLHRSPVRVEYRDGVVTLEGETDSVAAKKMALERAAAVPGVAGIVDRLHVAPSQRMGDGAIRDHVLSGLIQEQLLDPYDITVIVKGAEEAVRRLEGSGGEIRVEVADGIVTLTGSVASWSQKRLAGVMAWWVPGTRDVVNGLEVSPPEEDNDEEIVDAVRLVLEEDPFVDASQIRISCRERMVTLEGLVMNEGERRMAENDAWCVFRVDRVINDLQIMQ